MCDLFMYKTVETAMEECHWGVGGGLPLGVGEVTGLGDATSIQAGAGGKQLFWGIKRTGVSSGPSPPKQANTVPPHPSV